MPYIRQEERQRYDDAIKNIVHLLLDKFPGDNGKRFVVGDLNYIVSSIVWDLFDALPSYTRGNELMGVISCVEAEFYRKKLADYEDLKEKEHGTLNK